MNSQIDIINLALANLSNLNYVHSLNDNSPETKQAEAHWDIVLEILLTEYNWNFATVTEKLTKIKKTTGKFVCWQNLFLYPSNCLKIINTLSVNNIKIPFEVAIIDKQKVICANHYDVFIKCITKDINLALATASFKNALAWRLAAEIAIAQTADKNTAMYAMDFYRQSLEQAKLLEAKEYPKAMYYPKSKWLIER